MQEQIADSAYRAQGRVESGESIVVGVNKYVDPTAHAQAVEVHRIDPALEREQRESLAAFRARRDGTLAAERLASLKRAAATAAPLMPEFIEAADAGCTLGEMSDALREVFSVHRPTARV
jgi:methylmalonyl-CoA mutase N-terminal domain/subunit